MAGTLETYGIEDPAALVRKFIGRGIYFQDIERAVPVSPQRKYSAARRAEFVASGLTTRGTPRKRTYKSRDGLSRTNRVRYRKIYEAEVDVRLKRTRAKRTERNGLSYDHAAYMRVWRAEKAKQAFS